MSDKEFKAMQNTLANIRRDIAATNQILETFQKQQVKGTEETIRAINNLLSAQQETHLASSLASLASKRDQLLNEEHVVSLERNEYAKKLEGISENYQKVQDELDEELNTRIRRIGAHIFRIVNDESEKQIQSVQKDKLEAFDTIRTKIKEIYDEKYSEFKNVLNRLSRNIGNFIGARKKYVDHIKTFIIDKKISQPIRMYIPFWVIETMSLKSGEKTLKVLGPGTISKDGYQKIAEYEVLGNVLEKNIAKAGLAFIESKSMPSKVRAGMENLHNGKLISETIMDEILKYPSLLDLKEIKVGG